MNLPLAHSLSFGQRNLYPKVDPEDMMYKLSLEHRMRDLAREDYLSGDIMNYKGIAGSTRETLTQ